MIYLRATDYQEMSVRAAEILAAQVQEKPNSVLGLATGGTPVATYAELAEKYRRGELDFSQVSTVNLDEYRGLPGDHPQSYRYFMQKMLFQYVNVPADRIFIPDGMDPDPDHACQEYENVIQRLGGVDLQLLGIGRNGHIGFNEPGTPFESVTHCTDLTESTVDANQRFFASKDEVPRQAYTMGIRTIMHAKKILLIATGADKAEILKKAFFGPVTPEVPASVLQLHPNFILLGDQEAMSLIG